MSLEAVARNLAWRIKGYPNRCAICSFQLAESADKGCVIGNCSYRPHDGSAEDGRVSRNRAELAEIQGIIAAALVAEGQGDAAANEKQIEHEVQEIICDVMCGIDGDIRVTRIKVRNRIDTLLRAASPAGRAEQATKEER